VPLFVVNPDDAIGCHVRPVQASHWLCDREVHEHAAGRALKSVPESGSNRMTIIITTHKKCDDYWHFPFLWAIITRNQPGSYQNCKDWPSMC
jgi:hypothetical protein